MASNSSQVTGAGALSGSEGRNRMTDDDELTTPTKPLPGATVTSLSYHAGTGKLESQVCSWASAEGRLRHASSGL